jgi:hypothetical protein
MTEDIFKKAVELQAKIRELKSQLAKRVEFRQTDKGLTMLGFWNGENYWSVYLDADKPTISFKEINDLFDKYVINPIENELKDLQKQFSEL